VTTPTHPRRRTAGAAPLAPSPAARVAVAVGLAVACGVGGHLGAGGAFSTPAVLGALLAAAVVLHRCADRERGWLWIAGQQVGTQVVVHTVLTLADPPPDTGPVPHDILLYLHVAAGLLAATLLRPVEHRVWATTRRVAAALHHYLTRFTGPAPATGEGHTVPAVRAGFRPGPRTLLGPLGLRAPPLTA